MTPRHAHFSDRDMEAAAERVGDTVLEPSAGTGMLAVMAARGALRQ